MSTEERTNRYDIIAALILGLATIAGAFSAYQASLWGGNSSTNMNEAVRQIVNGNSMLTQSNQAYMLDMFTWMEWKTNKIMSLKENTESNLHEVVAAELEMDVMHPRLLNAMHWADSMNTHSRDTTSFFLPTQSEAYNAELDSAYANLFNEGEQKIKIAQEQSEVGDNTKVNN